MENVLETYALPYNSAFPVVCMDEQPVQLLKETRTPIPATKDHACRPDYEYERAGTASILTQFRYDGLIVLFLLPLVVCLFLASKKGISNGNTLLILIGGIILMTVFVPVLTENSNTPYRILPLVFFFAIGVGTLFSKNIKLKDELLSRKS